MYTGLKYKIHNNYLQFIVDNSKFTQRGDTTVHSYEAHSITSQIHPDIVRSSESLTIFLPGAHTTRDGLKVYIPDLSLGLTREILHHFGIFPCGHCRIKINKGRIYE